MGIRRPDKRSPRTALSAAWIALVCGLLTCLALTVASPATAEALEHIVIVWLQEPGNAAQRARIVSESRILRKIPGVTGLRAGSMQPSERPIVDSSFDVALIVSLEDASRMADYLSHPVHVKLVEETLKPLVKKIRVYDFTMVSD
ncbi:MAG TPA: Dabb family protein [Gammaproteobacteria bacterium]|nr:Dabb family protein [Gammaproteobacteria bacterium]